MSYHFSSLRCVLCWFGDTPDTIRALLDYGTISLRLPGHMPTGNRIPPDHISLILSLPGHKPIPISTRLQHITIIKT